MALVRAFSVGNLPSFFSQRNNQRRRAIDDSVSYMVSNGQRVNTTLREVEQNVLKTAAVKYRTPLPKSQIMLSSCVACISWECANITGVENMVTATMAQ